MIVAVFPPDERGKAVGAWTAWGGIGTVLGPLIGGQLVDTASWRWIFAINIPIVLLTLFIVFRAVPEGRERDPNARVDVVGATLCALGLAGMTFGLIEQPLRGWGDPAVFLSLTDRRRPLFAGFIVWEARTAHPMLPLGLFRRRNFAIGNIETFSMYGGLGLLFFFLVLFLQQVAGYNALEAGVSSIPVTLVMFALSTRFGMLADRHGPRFFMGVGPLVAALGPGLVPAPGRRRRLPDRPAARPARVRARAVDDGRAAHGHRARRRRREQRRHRVRRQQRDRARGRASWRSPGSARSWPRRSGRSSTRSWARARRAIRSWRPRSRTRSASRCRRSSCRGCRRREQAEVSEASENASVDAFHVGIGIATVLVALGGTLGLIGIVNPRRRVEAEDCPGGQLVGVSREGARQSPCDWQRESEAAARAPG